MRQFSRGTKELIDRLYAPTGIWSTLTRAREDRPSLLAQIASSGEPLAIRGIAPLLLDRDPAVAAAAARAVHRLLQAVPPSELVWLDEHMRSWPAYSTPSWRTCADLKPERVADFGRFGEAAVALMGLASFHASGYVRQAAIEQLDAVADGQELPFLLVRLNDWVEPVRARARWAVERRIRETYAGHFIRALPLVLRLGGCGRDEHGTLIAAVTRLLEADSSREALMEGMASGDRMVRRLCFQLVVERRDESVRPFIESGLNSPDPIIRLRAARKVPAAFEGAALHDLLARMGRDRFTPVRLEALKAYVERLPEVAPGELRKALLDPHRSVRELAIFHLRRSEALDAGAFYRDVLARSVGPPPAAAISGLGDTGTAGDAAWVLPHVDAGSNRVRQAALHALARLDGVGHVSVFLEALRDDLPGVAREAGRALRALRAHVGIGQLWAIFEGGAPSHGRAIALSLLVERGKWESIPFLTRATADPEPRIARQAADALVRWVSEYNCSFAVPRQDQLADFAAALEQHGPTLAPEIRERLLQLHAADTDLLDRTRPHRRPT